MPTPDITGAYTWAVQKCNAPDIGYSQQYRDERTVNGITYYDCSSFIWYALLHNGFDCITANGGSAWPFVTASMPYVLPALGFEQITQYTTFRPFDIVLNPGVHTEIVHTGYLQSGITMGAHNDSVPLADQVSINNYTTHAFDYPQLWRYTNGVVGDTYTCWMGWIPNESIYPYLSPNGLAVNGDSGKAYGMYQFDYRYGLVPFMQTCVDYDSVYYSWFNQYIALGVGNANLVANSGLIALFQQYASQRTDEFQYLQDKVAVTDYLKPGIDYVKTNYGYDITQRDPTILGSLFSMCIRAGVTQGAQCFSGGAGMSDLQLISASYAAMAQLHYDEGRWITGTPISQLDKCINAYYSQTDFYVVPYGGYSPVPHPTHKPGKMWMYQRNWYYKGVLNKYGYFKQGRLF